MKKTFFQKKLKIVFTPCFLFWTLIDEGKAWWKNVFFLVFKKNGKKLYMVYIREKKGLFDNENQKCQCEIKNNLIFSFLIIKMDPNLHFCHRKIAVCSDESSKNEPDFEFLFGFDRISPSMSPESKNKVTFFSKWKMQIRPKYAADRDRSGVLTTFPQVQKLLQTFRSIRNASFVVWKMCHIFWLRAHRGRNSIESASSTYL